MLSGQDPSPYQILIPIADPDQLAISLAVAVPLARARQGRVVPLLVAAEEAPPPWLIIPQELRDVVAAPIVAVGRKVGEVILAYARELPAKLLLVHWKGQPSRGRYLLGRTLDPVIQYAPCDVAVVRSGEEPHAFVARVHGLRRVLVPTGGGPNAALALELALALGPDIQVTALRVANPHLGATALSAEWDMLRGVLAPWAQEERLRPGVILSSSVVPGILEEAQQGYDLVLIGATGESLVDRLLFGNLPQELALRLPLPLIIVRHHDPLALGALRRARWRLVNVLPQLTLDERVNVYRQVRRNARVTTDFVVMVVLASIIASLGLLLNSPAVIIGAMIMAPLMSALLGVGLGVVQGDFGLLRLALRTTLVGILLVLAVSAVIGLVMPDRRVTDEMLARSTPSLLDLAVALFSGAAAAYAICRRDVASALPGVAIAVALVPPLATVGLALVSGEKGIAQGAFLLFITNLAAIVAAAGLLFLWMGFHPNAAEEARARTFRGGFLGAVVLLVGITVVLSTLTINTVRRLQLRSTVQQALVSQMADLGPEVMLVSWNLLDNEPQNLQLEVTVRSGRAIAHEEVVALQQDLAASLQRPVSLQLMVIPITRLDILAPPTTTAAP